MIGQIIKGKISDWEVIIGLEVHAQVVSNSKLFSYSPTKFGAAPNTQVSLFDAAMPGMLPVINKKCVEQAVKTGLGLGAKVNLFSAFDRKNYFYADLPQGYQISQLYYPIIGEGVVHLDMPSGDEIDVGITRIHLEQDAGKSIHDQSPTETFIDLNRAGIALMEIVTEPDIRSSEQASEFMKKLRSILRYLGTCDGDMEKGSMRCDANISVRKVGDQKYGSRVEIKNLNSIKNMMRAIDFEANRQVALLEDGGIIAQETRLFDTNTGHTRAMRSKENSHDYRYFPDPDLLPLKLSQEFVDNILVELPELPDAKKQRYIKDLGLGDYDANVLVADKVNAEFFEVAAKLANPKLIANWIIGELFAALKKQALSISASKITPKMLASLVKLIENNTISGKIAKQVFELMFTTGEGPEVIIDRKGLKQVTNIGQIEEMIAKIISENDDKVQQYRGGKDKLFGFFVGQVMKLSQGQANPAIVNKILKEKL